MARAKRYPKVRELSNGRFTYRYSVINKETGKRKQKETKSFSTAKEAYQEGIRIEDEISKDIYIEDSKILIQEWADKWLDIYKSTGRVKNTTVYGRKCDISILKRKVGMMKLKDFRSVHYQSMLNDMKTEGKAKSTITNFHATASLMFRKAHQLELITKNPTQYAEIPVFKKTVEELENSDDLPKFLEKEELAALLKTAEKFGNTQMYHSLFILAYTGMRIGELTALKLSDIDMINKRISITKTLYEKNGIAKFELNTPKTSSSKRIIDLGDSVMKIIRRQEAWRNEYKIMRRNEFYNEADFLFVNTNQYPGYPCRTREIENYMKVILNKAGLNPKLTPHSLRHTYTSLMALAGVELPAIQRLLGHSDDKITRTVYLHVTKEKKKEAVDKLDMLMNGLL